jgi:hypothetical protein
MPYKTQDGAMPYKTMTQEAIQEFLRGQPAKPAILATVRGDGRLHAAPVWYDLDDTGSLFFNTGEDTSRAATCGAARGRLCASRTLRRPTRSS